MAILQDKDIKSELDDVQRIIKSIDAMLENRTKKETKIIYQSFIEKINFDPATKDDIKITMKFNEGIIQQLNEIYRGVVSKQDTAIFVLKNSFRLVV